uniref:PX domain-containing protein n=1 Tax=Hyaloperonospora arabidopsidis (strain Emoy2) TaxID=559515 RepID=M4BZC2_HYAAE
MTKTGSSQIKYDSDMSLVYLPEETWSLRYGSDYFTVAIVKFVVKEDEFALYELEIQNGRRIWKVLRRFSEFDRLQARQPTAKAAPQDVLLSRSKPGLPGQTQRAATGFPAPDAADPRSRK